MKKILVALSIAFLCAFVLASAEERGNLSADLAQINLIDLAQQIGVGTNDGLNVTQVASGKNASVNLVLGPPGFILKMHYHKYRDEIVYCIKGQAVMNLSGKESEMKAGDLIYIPASVLHGSEVTGNETLQIISIFVPPFDGKDRIYV